MTERPERDEPKRETTAPADAPDKEEGVRRLMRQLLNTPSQPQEAIAVVARGVV